MSIFSEKQRRFLRSEEWAPNKLFEDEDAKAEAEDESKLSPSVRDDRPERPEDGRDRVDNQNSKAKDRATKRSDDSKGDAEKDAGGGWTFTIRERPMPDPLASGKKRRKGAEDSEVRCSC